MIRKILTMSCLIALMACTQPEEPAIMEEPIASLDCGDEDGIGGTGCPAEASDAAVARNGASLLAVKP